MEMEWEAAEAEGSGYDSCEYEDIDIGDFMEEERPNMDIDPTGSQLVIVPDSNIWIEEVNILKELFNTKFDQFGLPIFVIAWMVLQEVEGIPNKRGKSRSSIDFINQLLKSKNIRVRSQTASECAVGELKFKNINADDTILQCALQSFKNTDSVVLVTNDKNLMNKAFANGLKACEGRDVFTYINKELLDTSSSSDDIDHSGKIAFRQKERIKPMFNVQYPNHSNAQKKAYEREPMRPMTMTRPIRPASASKLPSGASFKRFFESNLIDRIHETPLDIDSPMKNVELPVPTVTNKITPTTNNTFSTLTNGISPVTLSPLDSNTISPLTINTNDFSLKASKSMTSNIDLLITRNADSLMSNKSHILIAKTIDAPMRSKVEASTTNKTPMAMECVGTPFTNLRKKMVAKKRKDLADNEKRNFRVNPSSMQDNKTTPAKRKSGDKRREPEVKKRTLDEAYVATSKDFKEIANYLKDTFTKIIKMQMKAVYEKDWERVLKVDQPWNLEDSVFCLTQHWIAVFCDIFPSKGLKCAEKLHSAVKEWKTNHKQKGIVIRRKDENEVVEAAIGLFNMQGNRMKDKDSKELLATIRNMFDEARKFLLNFQAKQTTGREMFKKE